MNAQLLRAARIDSRDERVDSIIEEFIPQTPHNKLGDAIIKKLKIHVGPEHNHEAQMPEELKF